MKKWLSLLLCALLVLSLFAACANTNDPKPTDAPNSTPTSTDPKQDTPTPTVDPAAPLDDLPDRSFNDQTFTFGYFGSEDNHKYGCSVMVDEENGDLVDSVLYNRNNRISERFDVNIEGTVISSSFLTSGNLMTQLAAGTEDYDVLVGYQYYDISLASSGYLANLDDLNKDYLDLDASWWASDYNNNANLQDRTFWITGDITLKYLSNITACYVNAYLYDEYVKETSGSIYDVVRNKEWTLETMAQMCENVYLDLNANDAIDSGDQFGFMISLGMETAYSCGISTSQRSDDGEITIAIGEEENYDVLLKLCEINSADYTFSYNTFEGQITDFVEDRAMIYFRGLGTAEDSHMRNMKSSYYVVPIPMGNEYMDDYRTTCGTETNIISVPYCARSVEDSTFILEALAAESSKSVIHTYYDIILKDRYSRDNDSKEMIDMIHASVGIDFVDVWTNYGFDSYKFYFDYNTDTLASRIESNVERWEKLLETLTGKLEDIQ